MGTEGEKYFKELNLEAAKDFSHLQRIISNSLSSIAANKFIEFINKRAEALDKGKQIDEEDFYRLKNRSYDSGIILSAAYVKTGIVEDRR